MNGKILLSIVLSIVMLLAMGSCGAQGVMPLRQQPMTDVYEGWRLGTQAYTFNRFTFYDAVDKTASLGLDRIEAYPGQRLSGEKPNLRFDHNMSRDIRKEVKQKLKESGVKLVNYGVVGLTNNEAQCRKVFDFARDMGIETIVSEPPKDAFELIDKLCQQYGINVAIHNHPKPSPYWDPNRVLEVCKGRSKRIGACADTGHWMRSGVNPLEALKKLQGRIISLHFKDLNEFGKSAAHDVVWGTGKANVEALLAELHQQGFKGVFSIEYEYHWENSVPDIRQCVGYFNKVAERLKPTGWRELFAADLSNCIYAPGSWVMKDGLLSANRDEIIWTRERFGDFILDLEFKLARGSNSGIFLRCGSIQNWLHAAIEVQVLDSYGNSEVTRHDCGSIYDCLAPSKNMVRKAGEWNHCTVMCKANKIYVLLNGRQVIDMDLNLWTEAHKNPDGTANKFNTAYKDMPRVGHIGLQGKHGGKPIWYRNVKIKPISN